MIFSVVVTFEALDARTASFVRLDIRDAVDGAVDGAVNISDIAEVAPLVQFAVEDE